MYEYNLKFRAQKTAVTALAVLGEDDDSGSVWGEGNVVTFWHTEFKT